METDVTIGLAFVAGFISFVSPCVLPLVPAYVGYMGGRATTAAGNQETHKLSTFLHGVFFVMGFTLFFVGFGLMTAAASSFLNSIGFDIPTVLTRLGGIAVILFGLYVMKLLDPVFSYGLKMTERWKNNRVEAYLFTLVFTLVLYGYFFWVFDASGIESIIWATILFLILLSFFRKPMNEASSLADFWQRAITQLQIALVTDTRKLNNAGQKEGYLGSLGLGIVFSAGWTPCIGPIYAAVLALATQSATEGSSLLPAATMLTAYSLGLGIPFLLTALAFNQSTKVMNKFKKNMLLVERVSGVFLILIGVLILTGTLAQLSARFGTGDFAEFSGRTEACTAGLAEGRVEAGNYLTCVSDGYDKITSERLLLAYQKDTASQGVYTFEPVENLESIPVGLQPGDRAPDFTLQTIEGDTVQLSELRGQPVLINFWATWCGPCREEMPEFERVYQLKKAQGFTIIAVNQTTLEVDRDNVDDFVEEFDLSFPIALDVTDEVSKAYRINAQPTNIFVDGNGLIVEYRPGRLSSEEILEILNTFETIEAVTGTPEAVVAPYVFEPVEDLSTIPTGFEEGKRAPDFTLQTLDNETVRLSDFRGQPVLLNFWATWCGPCRIEMPEFERVYQMQQDRGFTVLAVTAVDETNTRTQIESFINELGVSFPIIHDENLEIPEEYSRLIRGGLPISFILNGNGVIVKRHFGLLTGTDIVKVLDTFQTADEIEAAAQP